MKQTSFVILAGVTGLSILAAGGTLLTGRDAPAFAQAGERVLPNLETEASEVTGFELREGDFEMSIALRDGAFVDAASGYPVDPEPLKKLMSGMTLAEIAEAKTRDPARHADLSLASANAENGGGTEVILLNQDGDQIAHLIAGARDYTLGGVTGGQYVRRSGEDATWLAHARLDPPSRRAGWFETRLIEVAADEITSISLTTSEGQVISMTGEGGTLSIDPLLMEGRVTADSQLSRMTRLFETLDFTDVRAIPASNDTMDGAQLQADFSDGTGITLTKVAAAEGESALTWVRIDATGGTDTSETLLNKVGGFEFSLSATDAAVLDWNLDDLTEETAS